MKTAKKLLLTLTIIASFFCLIACSNSNSYISKNYANKIVKQYEKQQCIKFEEAYKNLKDSTFFAVKENIMPEINGHQDIFIDMVAIDGYTEKQIKEMSIKELENVNGIYIRSQEGDCVTASYVSGEYLYNSLTRIYGENYNK